MHNVEDVTPNTEINSVKIEKKKTKWSFTQNHEDNVP